MLAHSDVFCIWCGCELHPEDVRNGKKICADCLEDNNYEEPEESEAP